MDINDAKELASNATGAIAGKAIEVGTIAADAVMGAASNVAQLAQDKSYERRMARYNPVMLEEYRAEDYDLPNVIIIEDEDKRKGVDVCEGAIGWLSKINGVEVLHIYDKFVDDSGLTFYPFPCMGAVYYYDRLEPGRFINLAGFSNTVLQEKLTELKQVAYKLGAKECRLEIVEEESTSSTVSGSFGGSEGPRGLLRTKNVTANVEAEGKERRENRKTILFEEKLEGSSVVAEPELKWFKNDKEILDLIKKRQEDSLNRLKEYRARIDSTSMASMAHKAAIDIDAVLEKIGAKGNLAFSSEVEKQLHQNMDFYLVF